MGRPARAIASLLILGSSLSGASAVAEEPTPVEARAWLTAVSRREAYVYASTPDGLFRASLAARRWEKLKTPPEMPLNGAFASQPRLSPLIIYIVHRSRPEPQPRPGMRYGLYLSKDDGATWEHVTERDDFGVVLHHPSGALFAATGADDLNGGSHILRSPDMGKTWREITGTASGQFEGIEPDPDHPGLVRIHSTAGRAHLFEAEDESYRWKIITDSKALADRRRAADFFRRDSSTTNRFSMYPATLANYFGYDFGNQQYVHALEVAPLQSRYEFARGARVTVPVRMVYLADAVEGRPAAEPDPFVERIADQPGELDFWGIRVKSPDARFEKLPPSRYTVIVDEPSTNDGKPVTVRPRPPAAKYQVFSLSPSSPYERTIDLDRLADFSKPGEYLVQIIYSNAGQAEEDETIWDGYFTSPVFTIVIR